MTIKDPIDPVINHAINFAIDGEGAKGLKNVFDFKNYFKLIANNHDKFNTTVKPFIAQKLSEMADKELQKESKFSGIHLFAERCIQLLQGKGFQTKAEQAQQLVVKMEDEVRYEELLSQVKDAIAYDRQDKEGMFSNFADRINNLSPNDFEQLLKDVPATKDENTGFYDQLSDEKKELHNFAKFVHHWWAF